jgi:hypothetical protein
MQMMFHEAEAFDHDLGWCVDDSVILTGAFAGTKCADGVEAAEDQYTYFYYYYDHHNFDENAAEAIAMASACGLTVVFNLGEGYWDLTLEPTISPTSDTKFDSQFLNLVVGSVFTLLLPLFPLRTTHIGC